MFVLEPTWESLCMFLESIQDDLYEMFVEKYYGKGADRYLVWKDIEWMLPWPLFVNDEYFSLDEVYTALRYNIPERCLMQYLDHREEEHNYNLKYFYLYIYGKNGSKNKQGKKS